MGRPRVDPQPAIDVGSTRGISKIDRVSMRCRPGVDPRSIKIDPLIGPGSIMGSRWNGNRARIEPEFDSGSLRDRSTRSRCGIDPDSMRDPPWFDLNRPGYDPVRPGIDAGLPGIDQGSIRVDQGWIRSLCSIRYRSAVDPSRSRSTWDRSGVSPGSVRDLPGVGPRSGAKQEGTGDRPGVCPAPTQCQLRCQPNVSPVSTRNRSGSDSEST